MCYEIVFMFLLCCTCMPRFGSGWSRWTCLFSKSMSVPIADISVVSFLFVDCVRQNRCSDIYLQRCILWPSSIPPQYQTRLSMTSAVCYRSSETEALRILRGLEARGWWPISVGINSDTWVSNVKAPRPIRYIVAPHSGDTWVTIRTCCHFRLSS